MPHLDPNDHAFASGPVFRRPSGLYDALRATGSLREARRLLEIWRRFAAGAQLGDHVRLALSARIINHAGRDALTIGSHAMIRGILRLEAQGHIAIGHDVYIGDGVILSSAIRLSIGRSSFLAHGVQVFDNDTHPLDPTERQAHLDRIIGGRERRPYTIPAAQVSIGERCWIGMNSLIMKGVTIGDGAIVAAGSVVVKTVEPGTIVAGNPARLIRELDS